MILPQRGERAVEPRKIMLGWLDKRTFLLTILLTNVILLQMQTMGLRNHL